MHSFGRLKIVKQLQSGSAQIYVVFDPERKRELLLHLLPPEPESAVWEKVNAGLRAARKIIVERGTVFGVPYVVTEYLLRFEFPG